MVSPRRLEVEIEMMQSHVSASMTLRQFFEAHYVPHCMEDPSSRNREGYERALRLWESLTPNSCLADITSNQVSEFKSALLAYRWRGRPLAINTVRKQLAHVQWILDQSGPRGRGSMRTACGLIAEVPYTRLPKPRRSYQRQTPAEQIAQLYHACDQARLPVVPGVRPGALWQALLATMCSTSLRIGQLAATPMDAVRWDEQLLILPAAVCRKSKTEEPKPLHPFALQRLMAIRGDRELLFPTFPKPHSKNTIYRELHRLQSLAGLPHFGFHGVRRFVLTSLSQVSPAAAQLAAGHASYETTMLYQDLAILEDAVQRMPLFAALSCPPRETA